MEEVVVKDLCDCMVKLDIIGRVKKYDSSSDTLSNYSEEAIDGEYCLVSETVVDNSNYDNDDNFIYNFEVRSELYKIHCCPICGKRISYEIEDKNQMKLIL